MKKIRDQAMKIVSALTKRMKKEKDPDRKAVMKIIKSEFKKLSDEL